MKEPKKTRVKKSDIGYGWKSTFPKQLRALLDTPDMTQEKLANAIGVARQSVAQWKDGNTIPDIYHLTKIAAFFDVPYEYLLDGVPAAEKKDVDISKVTGLSSQVIEALQLDYFLASQFDGHSYADAIDILFSVCDKELEEFDEHPGSRLIDLITHYFFITRDIINREVEEKGSVFTESTKYDVITTEDLETLLLLRIAQRLKYMRGIAIEKIIAQGRKRSNQDA